MKFVALYLLWSVFSSPLIGQTTEGTILGRVTDAVTGEVITTAKVTAVQKDTGAQFRVIHIPEALIFWFAYHRDSMTSRSKTEMNTARRVSNPSNCRWRVSFNRILRFER